MTRQTPKNHNRRWTTKDDHYLTMNWGHLQVASMAKRLGRTEWGVLTRARDLGLGALGRGTRSLAWLSWWSGFSYTKIKQAIRKLRLAVPRIRASEPGERTTNRYAFDDDLIDMIVDYMLENEYIYADRKGSGKTTRGRWGVGKKPDACLRCGRTDKPHFARGHCAYCYNRMKGYAKSEGSGNPNKNYRLEPLLDEDDVLTMRNMRFGGDSYSKLARFFGVSRSTVALICKNQLWKHVGGPVEPYTYNNVNRTDLSEQKPDEPPISE